MALLSSITVRVVYFVSTSYNSLLDSGVGTPLIQVLLILVSLYTIHRLYLQQKFVFNFKILFSWLPLTQASLKV